MLTFNTILPSIVEGRSTFDTRGRAAGGVPGLSVTAGTTAAGAGRGTSGGGGESGVCGRGGLVIAFGHGGEDGAGSERVMGTVVLGLFLRQAHVVMGTEEDCGGSGSMSGPLRRVRALFSSPHSSGGQDVGVGAGRRAVSMASWVRHAGIGSGDGGKMGGDGGVVGVVVSAMVMLSGGDRVGGVLEAGDCQGTKCSSSSLSSSLPLDSKIENRLVNFSGDFIGED